VVLGGRIRGSPTEDRSLGSCGCRGLRWNQRPGWRRVHRIPSVSSTEAMEKLMRRVRRLVARLTEVGSGGIDGLQSNRDNIGRRP